MGLIDSIISAESGGNPTAKNPNSTATGLGQFIESTWLDTISRHRPDLVQGRTPTEILALRNDPKLSAEMTEAYAADNGRVLSQAGHEVTPGTTYLAHFAGPKGAVSVLSADPSTPVSRLLKPAAIEANPFLVNMTAGDLRAWADRKMGGRTAQAQPTPASPVAAPSAPLNLPSQAPVFPQAAQAPQQAQAQDGGLFAQMPASIEAAPIFYAQRRMPDLSKLKSAFKPPVFRG